MSLESWRDWIDSGAPLPRGGVVITFDDGYRDFLKYAWPLLRRYRFSATVYLVAGHIGHTNRWDHQHGEILPLLDWGEIRGLQAEGVSFGSHSVSHRSLRTLSLMEIRRELVDSQDILQQGLSIPIRSFAYPYGEHNLIIEYLTGACGYDIGLACRSGSCTVDDSLLALPRIEIEGTDDLESFIEKLDSVGPSECQAPANTLLGPDNAGATP